MDDVVSQNGTLKNPEKGRWKKEIPGLDTWFEVSNPGICHGLVRFQNQIAASLAAFSGVSEEWTVLSGMPMP